MEVASEEGIQWTYPPNPAPAKSNAGPQHRPHQKDLTKEGNQIKHQRLGHVINHVPCTRPELVGTLAALGLVQRSLRPSHSMYAWTPRLFSGDAELREAEPLLSAFAERFQWRESRTQTNRDDWTEGLIDRLIQDAGWVRDIITLSLCQSLTLE
jgi:hypothetical protein